MNNLLKGRLILIAEDDPVIALQMTKAFEDVGAWVLRARTLKEALAWVEGRKLCAAVLDHTLSDSDTSTVCKRMNARNIPFVLYSGYEKSDGAARQGVHVKKSVGMPQLIATVDRVIAERQISIQQQVSAVKHVLAARTPRHTLHLS
jgi:DNA-binding NtrC family response regulator